MASMENGLRQAPPTSIDTLTGLPHNDQQVPTSATT